jgi:hypothetical protein
MKIERYLTLIELKKEPNHIENLFTPSNAYSVSPGHTSNQNIILKFPFLQ